MKRFQWLPLALALVTTLLAASLSAQPVPPRPPRPLRPGLSRPAPFPVEAPRVEEEIDGAARVALLNLDRSALGALVESALRDKKIVNWWPRAATAALLEEAQLYPGLDVPARLPQEEQGKPSLPDAIVLLRKQVGGKAGQAEVIVCDPALGLRLGVDRIDLTGDPAEDVNALTAAATAGLKKLGEKMRQLWAVPPFHNADLLMTRDLRSSLAREAEQALLSQPGTFVAELDYAHVLAAARRIAGIEDGIKRPVPRYLEGTYRHDKDASLVALTIAIHEGEAGGEPRRFPPVDAQQAPQRTRDAVAELAKSAAGIQSSDDPATELNVIASVARQYLKEGNWRASLALAESRLLLDPSDRQWRSQAIGHAARLMAEQMQSVRRLEPPRGVIESRVGRTLFGGGPPNSRRPLAAEYVQAVVESLDLYRRAMRHFEQQLTISPSGEARGAHAWIPNPGQDFMRMRPDFSTNLDQSPELSLLMHAFHRQRQVLILRYNEIAAANGETGDMVVFSEMPADERRDLVARMIVDFRLYPRAEMRNQTYINAAFNYSGGREKAEEFLAQLATLSDPTVKKVVEQQRQQLARITAARPAAAPRPMAAATAPSVPMPDKPDPDAQIVFTPLSLPWKNIPDTADARAECELFLSLGKAGDLFCRSGQVLLSKRKGEYKLIWESSPNQLFRHMTSAGYGPSLACYDGKYAWVPLVDAGKPSRLLVIDPETEKVAEVTDKDGMPAGVAPVSSNALLAATALGPGKALLAGSFGRAWLGVAAFDPEKGASVKVIHEARDLPIPGERDQHTSATLAFDPTWLLTLEGRSEEGEPIRRVLVGRYAIDASAAPFPLVVDPESEKVEVLAAPMAVQSDVRPIEHNGDVYWLQPWFAGANRGQELWQLSLPDQRQKSLGKKPLAGDSQNVSLAMQEGKVHLVQQQWHSAPSWDEPLAPLAGKPPGEQYHRRLPLHSEIHGWLLLNASESRVHAVEFKDR